MSKLFFEGDLLQAPSNKESLASLNAIIDVAENESILEDRPYKCDRDGTLYFRLNEDCIGIIERGEFELNFIDHLPKKSTISRRVNQPTCFVALEVSSLYHNGHVVVKLSRKRAQEKCYDDFIGKMIADEVISGRIVRTFPTYTLVDVGAGITGMLPRNSICVSRSLNTSERFNVGQDIYAKIVRFDDFGRPVLSHKELLGTWEENAKLFSTGETVCAVARNTIPLANTEKRGLFIELLPNLCGLAEIDPNLTINFGQEVTARIRSISQEKQKIKLDIINIFPDYATSGSFYYWITSGVAKDWMYKKERRKG